jgi:hypothetical protein
MNKNNISFDIIGDLFLETNASFNWENKSTSLYCIITGNISNDISVIKNVLVHLNKLYQGVFYIAGHCEFSDIISMNKKNSELQKICNSLPNVLFLNNYVIIIDNIALIGINNWYNSEVIYNEDEKDLYKKIIHKYISNDTKYLESTIKELQLHVDISQIIIVSSCSPSTSLFFNTIPNHVKHDLSILAKTIDLESKINYWIFGDVPYDIDMIIDKVRYVNNPMIGKNPYWAKRLEVN